MEHHTPAPIIAPSPSAPLPLNNMQKEAIRRKCVKSFYEFVKHAWPQVDPAPFIDAWHIKVMCHHLQLFGERKIKNLIINIPPGHGKSLIASVLFPAWQWLNVSSEIFLCTSHSESLTTRDSGRCRDLLRSEWYQDVMRPKWKMKNDQDEKTYYKNNAHGARYSFGVTGKATGQRGTIKIIDDPLDSADAESSTKRTYVNEVWFDQKMMTRLIDPTYGNLIIAQRLHENDITGHIMKKYPGMYEVLCLQAEYDPAAITAIFKDAPHPHNVNRLFVDPRSKSSEVLLFPKLYDIPRLALLKRALGSIGASAQLQQAPKPRGGIFFKDVWFRHYAPSEVTPEDFVQCFQSWDCAVKDKPENDRVAGQVWGKIRADHPKYPNRYCLYHAVAKRADIVNNLGMIKHVSAAHVYAKDKLIEDKANGSPIITMLRKQLKDDHVIAFDPKSRSKQVRASAVAPVVEAGMVIIPYVEDHEWVREWIDEITGFDKAEHDDQCDAFTQAILHFTQDDEWVFSF